MSRDEGFLARWSRRKQRAGEAQREAAKAPARTESPAPAPQDAPSPAAEGPAGGPAVAPEGLPPIASLDAASDIKPFLAPGVPPELTREALRRAWLADGTIRDFIGLAENAWDFTAPDGVPGFGSLSAENVERLLAQAFGSRQSDSVSPPRADQSAPAPNDAAIRSGQVAQRHETEDETVEHDRAKHSATDAAAQHQNARAEAARDRPSRSHGGALPK
jgi:hypothetical protein